MNKMFLDGKLVEADSLEMPVLSRGFAFGFGVFETMKFIDGQPCFFREHVNRLRRGAESAGLGIELDERVLRSRAIRLFKEEGLGEGVFKIVISDTGESTQVAMFVRTPGIGGDPSPVNLVSSEVRKASQAFTSRHKSLNYMESVLELQKAQAAGFEECVFRNESGELTECSVANLFWVREGVIQTPALECGLLDGIVRAKVIALAKSFGWKVEEGRFAEDSLLAAQEAFLTSSGKGPCAVASFRSSLGKAVAFGTERLPRLRAAYLELEKSEGLLAND